MRSAPARIVVLASGSGTNCQALIDACAQGEIDGQIVGVVSNNSDAGVLARAQSAGIESHVVEHSGKEPLVRRAADARLIELVSGLAPDLVVLAGWMRILGAEVGSAFPMINLHPALPGQFPGIRAIERAFEAWTEGQVTNSGVMIHWVPDEGVDVGPVIVTEAVPFQDSDELMDFAARIQACEHRLIVEGCRLALNGRTTS